MRLRKTASRQEMRWVLGLLVVVACGRPAEPPSGGSARPERPERSPVVSVDAARRGFDGAVIARLWPDGCFTARDPADASDRGRCAAPRRPYSTFKLANALIAVDAGVLDGPDAAMAAWLESDVEDIDEARAVRDRRLRATLDALGVFPAQ